jgi:hypothetical protein
MHIFALIYLTKPPDYIGVAEVVCKAMNSPEKWMSHSVVTISFKMSAHPSVAACHLHLDLFLNLNCCMEILLGTVYLYPTASLEKRSYCFHGSFKAAREIFMSRIVGSRG